MISASTLVEEAKCLGCIGISQPEQIKLALLQRIAASSVSCAQQTGTEDNPVGIYLPDFTGQLYQGTYTSWKSTGPTVNDWTLICDSRVTIFNATTFDRFGIVQDNSSTQFSFPNLTTVIGAIDIGSFAIYECTALTSISAPLLTSVDDDISFENDTALTSINLMSLQTINVSSFQISGCTSLTGLALPALVAIGGDVLSVGCTVLNSLAVPVWLPTDGTTIDFSGCALDVTSINLILARCVAAGVTTCTITLNGGTNAAPAGQGAVDKAALIGAGNTVTTN